MTSGPHGVLVVDKPRGPTSHDLVAWARRALGTRSVGHAGTLDPLASGVLVLLVGEATKLSPFLSADDKRYEAVIALGRETDTLDMAGVTIAEAPVPALTPADVERALVAFQGETLQRAPVISALKKDGVTLHARTRRGETVEAPVRSVLLHSSTLLSLSPTSISLALDVGKGFYVRSLARDLALALGTRGHLASLCRTASGAFTVAEGLDAETLRSGSAGDEAARSRARAALIPLAIAGARAMPTVTIDAARVADARTGRAVSLADDAALPARIALLDEGGSLVAVAERGEGGWRVVRGFAAVAT